MEAKEENSIHVQRCVGGREGSEQRRLIMPRWLQCVNGKTMRFCYRERRREREGGREGEIKERNEYEGRREEERRGKGSERKGGCRRVHHC